MLNNNPWETRLAGPPRWRLLEAQWPGVDIIAGASLALGTLNLPESVVKARSWFPRRFLAPISASSKGIPSTKWPSADSVDQHHAHRPIPVFAEASELGSPVEPTRDSRF